VALLDRMEAEQDGVKAQSLYLAACLAWEELFQSGADGLRGRVIQRVLDQQQLHEHDFDLMRASFSANDVVRVRRELLDDMDDALARIAGLSAALAVLVTIQG
jgi:hypothetical protein